MPRYIKRPGMARIHFISGRLLRLGLGFMTATLCYSIVLNSMLETTIKAQIEESLQGFRLGLAATDPIERESAMATHRRDLEREFWLDRPAWQRVLARAVDIVTLDLGLSQTTETNYPERSRLVLDIVKERLKPTLLLFSISSGISILLGVALGKHMAARPGGGIDRGATALTMIFFGTPPWWVASFMVLLFVYTSPVFKIGALHSVNAGGGWLSMGLDYTYYLSLPVLTLVLIKTWSVAYFTRMMTVVPLQEDYVMAARGQGIPESKILSRHGLRVAAPGITTLAAQVFAQSICGDILIEQVMARPGLGSTLVLALHWNDIPLVTGIIAMITAIYCITFAIMDIMYVWLDPRITYGLGTRQ